MDKTSEVKQVTVTKSDTVERGNKVKITSDKEDDLELTVTFSKLYLYGERGI